MAYELRDNNGSLFKNQKKEKDAHPDATGTAMIGGVVYYISAWTKEGKSGRFQSLAFKRKDEAQKHSNASPETNKNENEFYDDSIHF